MAEEDTPVLDSLDSLAGRSAVAPVAASLIVVVQKRVFPGQDAA